MSHFSTRIHRRIAWSLYERFGYVKPELFGYGARSLFEIAKKENADLTIVHSEAGLWVGAELLKVGKKVGIDMEDWFSADLPEDARTGRPIQELRAYEQLFLSHSHYALTTSSVLAKALGDEYEVPEPAVIYNTFPLTDRDHLDKKAIDRRDHKKLSLHWFSHTIGLGRGLETLLDALHLLKNPVEIHLRGASTPELREKLFRMHPLSIEMLSLFTRGYQMMNSYRGSLSTISG